MNVYEHIDSVSSEIVLKVKSVSKVFPECSIGISWFLEEVKRVFRECFKSFFCRMIKGESINVPKAF